MKKQIWKFEITSKYTVIEMPNDAEILTVQTQNEKPCIWALVNPKNETETRFFETYGTGHEIECDMGVKRKYINTFQLNGGVLVFHLFERLD